METQETRHKSNYERMVYLLPIFRWNIVYTVQCAYALQLLRYKFEYRQAEAGTQCNHWAFYRTSETTQYKFYHLLSDFSYIFIRQN